MPMNKNISIKNATFDDWPAIATLLQTHRLPLQGAQDNLENYWIAMVDGQIVGTAGAEVYGSITLLRSVAVEPSMQRLGLGKVLVDLVLENAQERGATTVYLLTDTAQKYFSAMGFEQIRKAEAPVSLQASAELKGACPASAVLMALALARCN